MFDLFEICPVCKATDEEPEYSPEETGITNLLEDAAADALEKGDEAFTDATRRSIASMSDLLAGLGAMAPFMKNVQTYDVDQKYLPYIQKSMLRGSQDSGSGDYIKYALRKADVESGIVKASKYYTNKFFNDQVIPKIQKYTQQAIEKGTSSRQLFDEVRGEINERFKSVRYWNGVANNSASRAFSYGLCKGGVYAGHSTVRFNAVLDSRTSQICHSMNGTEWSIHRCLDVLEDIALADPENVKNVAPWVSYKEFEKMTDDDISAAGVMVPPLHFHCRSVLELV